MEAEQDAQGMDERSRDDDSRANRAEDGAYGDDEQDQ